MKKIDYLFIAGSLLCAIVILSNAMWHNIHTTNNTEIAHKMPDSQFGNFLAAQQAIYMNDFKAANNFADTLNETQYPVVQNTKLISIKFTLIVIMCIVIIEKVTSTI